MKKKRLISNMGLICLVSIVSLNLIGVGYGMWSDSVDIEISITTGNIDPVFDFDNNTEIISENGELALNIIDNGKTATVTGWCYQDSSNYIDISLGVSDSTGSIPTRFDSDLNSNDSTEAIKITESGSGISLIIDGSQIESGKSIKIDRDIAFRAFNQIESRGWVEYLKVESEIEVKDMGNTEKSNVELSKEIPAIQEVEEIREDPVEEEVEEIETELELEEKEAFKIQEQSESVQLDNNTRLEGE